MTFIRGKTIWKKSGGGAIPTFHHDLYVMDLASKKLKRLVSGGVSSPGKWSPDGKRVVFLRMEDKPYTGELEVITPDGQHRRQITNVESLRKVLGKPDSRMLIVGCAWLHDSATLLVTTWNAVKTEDRTKTDYVRTHHIWKVRLDGSLSLLGEGEVLSGTSDGRWFLFRMDKKFWLVEIGS